MRRPRAFLPIGALAGLLAAAGASAELAVERVASRLDRPVWVTHAPSDPDRLFIVEQPGTIKILRGGVVLARPFLDITDVVFYDEMERGCLGLAFDPDYETNGHFYVYYTGGTGTGSSLIRRWTVSADPDSADASSATRILRLQQLGANHNGGHIEFGPDGFLYLGLGDGGGQGDPQNQAQDPQSLFGKMLRIDPRRDDFPTDPWRNYGIPPSNPFVGNPGVLDEIWALGLRNPYRFAFDRATGDLYVGDVGQNDFEEIDFQPASSAGGENYGWRLKEGDHCFEPPSGCPEAGLVDPVHEYDHPTGFSVTGGRVYRGSAIPSLAGRYLFADFITDRVWSFRIEDGRAADLVEHTEEIIPGRNEGLANIVGFGEDLDGEIYIADLGRIGTGEIYQLVPDLDPPPPAPPAFSVTGGFPNPFRSTTRFEITHPDAAALSVTVHTSAGRLVRRLVRDPAAGSPSVFEWDGRDDSGRSAPAGVYFLRAGAGERVVSRRIVLIR